MTKMDPTPKSPKCCIPDEPDQSGRQNKNESFWFLYYFFIFEGHRFKFRSCLGPLSFHIVVSCTSQSRDIVQSLRYHSYAVHPLPCFGWS